MLIILHSRYLLPMFIGSIGALLLLSLGCDSSLVDDVEPVATVRDGGIPETFEPLEVVDGRRFPKECTTLEDCDDGDPCTQEFCRRGTCRYETQQLSPAVYPIDTLAPVIDVALGDETLWIGEERGVIEVFDIAVPGLATKIGNITTTNPIVSLEYTPRLFLVAEGEFGTETINYNNLELIGSLLPDEQWLSGIDYLMDFHLGPRYALASGFSQGVSVVDWQDGNPSLLTLINTAGRATSASSNEFAGVVSDALGGLQVIAFPENNVPEFGGAVKTEGRVVSVDVKSDTVAIAETGSGFGVLDISDPYFPRRLLSYPTQHHAIIAGLLGPQTLVIGQEDGRIDFYSVNIHYTGSPVENELGEMVPGRRPMVPTSIGGVTVQDTPVSIAIQDSYIAIALKGGGVRLLDTGCISPL